MFGSFTAKQLNNQTTEIDRDLFSNVNTTEKYIKWLRLSSIIQVIQKADEPKLKWKDVIYILSKAKISLKLVSYKCLRTHSP